MYTGSTRASLKFKNLRDVVINAPDKEEQKKRLNVLRIIDRELSILGEIKNKLDDSVKSRFIEMFENDLAGSCMTINDIAKDTTIGIANSATHAYCDDGDEAHIYMANDTSKMKAVEKKSLEIFEKISKEGRKYGVALVIVSQRPAELNTTIISQCNNIISLKITNDRDKSDVSAMLTDSLVGIVDTLPNLDVGECIAVGDAIKLPVKILLDKPQEELISSTINFWDRWNDRKDTVFDIDGAIKNMIKQSRK